MFFTWIGKVLAYVLLVVGLLRVAVAIDIAYFINDLEESRAAAREFLSVSTAGQAIDQGAVVILIAIILGVLCEISSSVGRTNKPK